MEERLTKDEKKALRRAEWQADEKKKKQREMINKYGIWAGGIALIVISIVGLMWLVMQPTPSQTQAINVAPISNRDISEGPKDAKVKLIEYADFQCPACAAYHPIITQLMETYKNKILYAYRMFPLTNIHKNSHISSQAAYAAHKQGAFFVYDDQLYNNQKDWADVQDPRSIFIDYAKGLKLDIDKFTSDMNSDETKKYVNDSEQAALSEGLNSTPSFIINGNKITNPNSLDDFKKAIDNALKQK